MSTTMRDEADRAISGRRGVGRPANPPPAPNEETDSEVAAREMEAGAVKLAEDIEFSGGALAIQKTKLEVERIVTVPVLKFENGTAIICQIIEPIVQGQVENKDGKRAYVTKIQSPRGQLRTLVVGDVLRLELQGDPNGKPPKPGAYPNDGYVGRWFHIGKFAPNVKADKRYATYQITEIKDPRGKPTIDVPVSLDQARAGDGERPAN